MPEGKIDRPLSPLLPRDCGHECRVCKVTVVSLTDYASHISSPTHKQNVEDAERKPIRNGRDEDYFDQTLVDLIEKRNEQIRKEKEAAAAKLAKEEEERKRKEEFQLRLKEAKERFQPEWPNSGGHQHGSWHSGKRYNTNPGYYTQNVRSWDQSNWGKGATWHAQQHPNFKQFSGEFSNKDQGNQWKQGSFYGKRVRPPWISSAGSSNGVYGCNNISQYSQNVRPVNLFGSPPPPFFPSLPKYFAQGQKPIRNPANKQGGQQRDGLKNGEKQSTEADHHSSKSSKTFGSDPKLDKTCRWSPYPITKGSESTPNLAEKTPSVQKPQKLKKTPESGALNTQSRPGQSSSSGKGNSNSGSSSLQKEGHKNPSPSPSIQRANKPAQRTERRQSSGTGVSGGAQPNKVVSSQTSEKLKSSSKNSLSSQSSGSLQSKSERQLPETLKKTRQLEKRSSSESSSNAGQNTVDDQRHTGVNKENNVRQNQAKPSVTDSLKPALKEKDRLPSSDSYQSLQLLQVSTSAESSHSTVPTQEDEENEKKMKKGTCVDTMVQSAEAGQCSETDNPKSDDAASQSSGLSKLDLPPVLKRDLTKHIGSKVKTGSHEPNLNIARRVRNLSGSRKSDPEKDSGPKPTVLKPTVQQLISGSGSRRNVNWEQVYHEVKKKQDKGKGMPRFGIEMVSLDQEDQIQEEDDFSLTHGFHWDSLMDVPTPPTSRKRSLSESSIAPAPAHTPFQSDIAPGLRFSPSDVQNDDPQQEMEPLAHCDAEEKPSESLVRAKAWQRSDSVVGESSSGTELWDGQGTGKKRRAARDVPLPETSCSENHNKRRKIKSKKERSHIDQLLAVSLREEELSRSLQTLDTDLIKARTALEAAYVEVQKLMMVKQQMSAEMSTLRNKRIELLQGMQADSVEREPRVRVKEEKLDMDEAELHTSSSVPSFTGSAASPAHRASPPSSCVPFTPLAIKEEPRSPARISSDAAVNTAYCAHSTTPELPTAASVPDPAFNRLLPSTETRWAMCQTYSEKERDAFGDPIDSKESLAELVRSMQKDTQASRSHAEHYSEAKVLTPSRRDSEMGSLVESAGAPSFETPSVPLEFTVPTSPSELRDGKRVRKLKKRKALKKAQGTELPESSDTEMDTEASRPRWLHPRPRSSGVSHVSTSTQQTDDRKEDVKMEGVEELSAGEDGPQSAKCTPKEPYVPLIELKLELDSEESKDVTHLDSSEAEAQNVASYEISSTSDMDISPAAESNVELNLTLPKIGKTSSDVLSDHDGDDELPTEGTFEGHVEAVNDMQIHNGLLYTCSGDRTVRAFDIARSHKCVAVFEGHSSKVNALLLSTGSSVQHRLYTGSSDQTIRCYCLKTQRFEQQFSLSDRVLCLHSRWKMMYAGLGNGTVVTFNLRTNKQMDVFECHGPRAVSCLASSQEGARRLLLVGSYDNTISVRDAKNGLLLRTLEGHSKTVLCMKVANDLVFSGSSDQCVHAHNIHTGQLVRVYKGHSHAVSVVSVLGKVMVTACLDKLVRVYDLQSHEQLQVYGGHEDMVMCMTIHKNMIYTGCYDGSVQAVKLNLMQNYRCRWHGCSMVFGLMEHLEHHLTHDHTSANLQTLRCRWKNCEEFFSARNGSKQGILVHMQKHAEEESHVEP